MLECTSVWLCTAQGSYRLRPSVWLHSKVSFLCGRSCVMSGTFSWTTGLFLQQRRMLCSGIFFPTGRGAAALSLYIYTYIYTAAERLGHAPYPRHCLTVLLSPDTAKNACIRLFSCTRSYFLCGRHFCDGHDRMERPPTYTAAQVLQNDFFRWRSAVVHPYLSATSTKPALRR